MKKCTRCNQLLPITSFHKDSHSKDGIRTRCKTCVNKVTKKYLDSHLEDNKKRNAEYYANNSERIKQKSKEWIANNPDRKKQSDKTYQLANLDKFRDTWHRRRATINANGKHDISRKEWLKLYSSPCIYCGSYKNIQADHVIPIARGGTHGIGNLVSACSSCNGSKGKRTITEWKKAKRNPRPATYN